MAVLIAAFAAVAPLVLIYFLAVRWGDRYEKEPLWALALCFLWGALGATLLGGASTLALEALTQDAIAGLTGSASATEAVSATVYAPLFEEGFKGLGLLAVLFFGYVVARELDGPLDGVVYGSVIGLGFTLTEDVLYIVKLTGEEGRSGFVATWLLRTVFSGFGHAIYTSLTGLGIGMVVVSRSLPAKLLWPALGFAAAVGLHGAHNALPSLLGGVGGLLAVGLTWVAFAAWLGLIAVLVLLERRSVLRELGPEVGVLVRDADELALLGAVFARGAREIEVLLSSGWGAYRAISRRHARLTELAIVKARIRRGDRSAPILREERQLRAELGGAASAEAVELSGDGT
jgi:protease PrsW